jgi:hypothetical protein
MTASEDLLWLIDKTGLSNLFPPRFNEPAVRVFRIWSYHEGSGAFVADTERLRCHLSIAEVPYCVTREFPPIPTWIPIRFLLKESERCTDEVSTTERLSGFEIGVEHVLMDGNLLLFVPVLLTGCRHSFRLIMGCVVSEARSQAVGE